MSTLSLLLKINELNSHGRWTRQQVTAYRDRSLRLMLHHAYDNSPFYRELYSSQGIKPLDLDDIPHEQLPAVDKEMLMDNFEGVAPEGITAREVEDFIELRRGPSALLRGKYHVIHSSGSTGSIGYFLYGLKDWETVKALALRIFPEFRPTPKRLAYVAAVDGHYAGVSLFLSPTAGGIVERIIYHTRTISVNKPVSSWVEILNDYLPQILCGYAAAINILACEQLEGRLKIAPRYVLCGGEPVTAETAANTTEAFGKPPIDFYSASESLAMGVKHPGSPCMQLFDDANYFEFPPDQDGFYLTNLYNYSFPMLRYRISDRLCLADAPPEPFLKATQVAGRSEQLLWLQHPDGSWDFIHPIVLVEFHSPGIKQFQFIRKSPTSLLLRAVFTNKGDGQLIVSAARRLREILSEKGFDQVRVEVEAVDVITPDPSTGKTPLIVTA